MELLGLGHQLGRQRLCAHPPSSLPEAQAGSVRALIGAVRGPLGLLLTLMDSHLAEGPK